MDSGCLRGVVRKLIGLSAEDLEKLLLTAQSRNFELTKSLVNLLYNICRTQSIKPVKATRQAIERNKVLVDRLLSRRVSLADKTRALAENLDLVYALTRSCPKPSPTSSE